LPDATPGQAFGLHWKSTRLGGFASPRLRPECG